MKTLGTIILFILLFTSMGYIVIEWHHASAVKAATFEKLCTERPDLKECPDREIGRGAP